MKLRISSSKLTAFRKDIFRFAPLWALYLIGGLLVLLSSLTHNHHSAASILGNTIGPLGWVNAVYAALCAQLLFGDLFNSRLCNALHAMPLKREDWFLSHITAGFLFSFVPNLIAALSLMPRLGEFWFVSFLWLGGMTLHFLFFFGLAVFCVLCTGNRFAMAAVYTLLNAVSMLAGWFVQTIYQPLLYGVYIPIDYFGLFCPLYELSVLQEYVFVDKLNGFTGLGSSWIYLLILAAIGIGLLVAALLMYRRRALECAGDFISFRPLEPVFLVIYSLTMGALFALFGDIIGSYLLFLAVGITVGYFTGQMLVQRTIKVFRPKVFIGFAVLSGLLILSVVLTEIDPLGITHWTPKAEDVKSVSISDARYSSHTDATFTEAEDIQDVIDLHKDLLKPQLLGDGTYVNINVTLTYELTNGTKASRSYTIHDANAAYIKARGIYSSPEMVLGEITPENCLDTIHNIELDGDLLPREQWESLIQAITADCEAGTMAQGWHFHGSADSVTYIEISPKGGNYAWRYLEIYEDAENTIQWMKENVTDFESDPD